jgi:hypothetical protein
MILIGRYASGRTYKGAWCDAMTDVIGQYGLVLIIVTHEYIAGTRKPRVQFSMSVQDLCIDAEEESPKPVQTSASDV